MRSKAVVPSWIQSQGDVFLLNVLSVVAGSILVAVLARIAIPLPWTPVPITGQTFGVALLSLLWGRKLAAGAFGLYLLEGAAGLPVFALGQSGLVPGPTIGYLVGMGFATLIVGGLADRGFARGFRGALLCCMAGSAAIFTCGLIGLSFFIPAKALLTAGLWPFLPGDLVKSSLAALIVSRLGRS